MVPYRVLTIDLTTARNRENIVLRDTIVEAVCILDAPGGLGCSIGFGASGDMIPLTTQGQTFAMCPGENDGVFFTNPAGAGSLRLLISYAQGPVSITA
jgi:hypothetical protein